MFSTFLLKLFLLNRSSIWKKSTYTSDQGMTKNFTDLNGFVTNTGNPSSKNDLFSMKRNSEEDNECFSSFYVLSVAYSLLVLYLFSLTEFIFFCTFPCWSLNFNSCITSPQKERKSRDINNGNVHTRLDLLFFLDFFRAKWFTT